MFLPKTGLCILYRLALAQGLLLQIIPQPFGPAGVAELAQGLGLDLAHSFPGDMELLAQLFQCPGPAIFQPEPQGNDPLFPSCWPY